MDSSKCEFIVASTGVRCKNAALAGCKHCSTHKRMLDRQAAEASKDDDIILPMAPNVSEVSDESIKGRAVQKRRVNEVEVVEQSEITKIQSEVSNLTERLDTLNIGPQLEKLTLIIDKLVTFAQSMAQPTKNAHRKFFKEKSVIRRAKALHYHNFKQKTDKVNAITQAAIQAKLLPANTIKAHWAYIKTVSDNEFDALPEIERKILLDTARHMLTNNIAVAK